MTHTGQISHLKSPRWDLAKQTAYNLTANFSSPPIPVLELAESSGVDVVFSDMGVYRSTVAGFCDFGAKKIYVNSADPINRKTFTIAHELGHWILHKSFFEAYPDDYPVLPRFQNPYSSQNPYELEANTFAANLLVPPRLLQPVKHAPAAYLANVFAVSRQMMENRLKNV